MGAAAGYWWQWNITVCIYTMMYLGLGVQKRCSGGAQSTDGLYDADKGAMKAKGWTLFLSICGFSGKFSPNFVLTCSQGTILLKSCFDLLFHVLLHFQIL